MGKSSSLKKKRSKNSSQSQKRKRNKVKTRRSMSKKLRRGHDDSSDSGSRSMVSVSSSGSEDDYRGRRSRSRNRKDVKGGKRRVRRRSSCSESSKVKSRRSKSKKLRRRHDSSDSDLRSMASVSSFSSEDDYRSLRSRSRNRKDVKGGKKRARRWSSSSESGEVFPRVKKRKGSRWDDRYEARKRTGKRKKSRRDVSVSSRSSGSWSCSTCWSDSDEIGHEKRRGKSERKEKDKRRLGTVERGSKSSRGRSRSCSSCSRYNEGSDHSIEERVMEASNSRRLKSVITVVKQENESHGQLNTDETKEVYDYDDYPSCRSNDSNSNDDCSRRELPLHPHVVSETKTPLDDEQGEVRNIRTCSAEENGKDDKPKYDGVGKNDALRENNKVSSATVGLNGDDMESVLRQRALENLRKFRGGHLTNINRPLTQNDENDGDFKTPSSVKSDPFQIETPKRDVKVVIASQVSQQSRRPPVGRDSTTLPENDGKTSDLNDDDKYSGTVGSDVASPPAQVVPAGVTRVKVNTAINSVSNKSKLVMSRTRREAPNNDTNKKQEAAGQEPSQAKLVTKSSVNEGGLETAQTVKPPEENVASISNKPKPIKSQIRQESPNICMTQKQESTALESSQAKLVTESSVNVGSLGTAQTVKPPDCSNSGDKVNDALDFAGDKPSSSSISTSGDISSDKVEDETKDGSQFQQKQMSVMRGGKMVQVNYQVYIPKRAPALARRRLKR